MVKSIIAIIVSAQIFLVSIFAPVIPTVMRKPVSGGDGTSVTLPLGGGCDPWFYEHEGKYYYCYSLGNGMGVKFSDSLATLFNAEGRRVYTAPVGEMYSSDYWAPEMHFIDGKWYIYVAADDGKNENHRMYVFSCETPDGNYIFEGKISDSTDKWAIDGTVLEYKGELWFIWSGWEGDEDGGQNLYIAHMDSPTHIDGERVLISKPNLSWEKKGMPINEGPELLYHGGRAFLVYSASGSWTDDYCLGILSLIGNPGEKISWVKNPLPVFKKTDTAFGPGHCSFVKSGGIDYIVYHANVESGTGWNDRSIRIQPFFFLFGVPAFGRPLPAESEVVIF